MARERGIYQRQDSPYWWVDVVLSDGRRVCKSTRLRGRSDAEEFLVRLKTEAYEAVRTGVPTHRKWQDAVVRYLAEFSDKRTLKMDRLHLRQLDPILRDKRMNAINMDVLWSFVRVRRERDGVSNATINRSLEVVRRILNLAHQDWNWLQKVRAFVCCRNPGTASGF